MSVDYDDQAPKLDADEDSRKPDPDLIEHDRDVRDIRRLEQEIRGRGNTLTIRMRRRWRVNAGDNERTDHRSDVRGGQR